MFQPNTLVYHVHTKQVVKVESVLSGGKWLTANNGMLRLKAVDCQPATPEQIKPDPLAGFKGFCSVLHYWGFQQAMQGYDYTD